MSFMSAYLINFNHSPYDQEKQRRGREIKYFLECYGIYQIHQRMGWSIVTVFNNAALELASAALHRIRD